MSIETQAILPSHYTSDQLSKILKSECQVKIEDVRAMHRPEYNIIEFIDNRGKLQALNVFLNSYAGPDYATIYSGESTLVTVEFSPWNFDVICALVASTGGFVQRSNGEPWKRIMVKTT